MTTPVPFPTDTSPIPAQRAPVHSPIWSPAPAHPPIPAPMPRRPRTGLVVALAAVLGALAGAGITAAAFVGSAATPPAAFPMTGTLTLSTTSSYSGVTTSGSGCRGTGGYSDIGAGSSVTVTDAAGAVVAVGSLDGGTGGYGSCRFTFTVPDVPATSAFYGVEVSHRGKVTFPAERLRSQGAILSLGN